MNFSSPILARLGLLLLAGWLLAAPAFAADTVKLTRPPQWRPPENTQIVTMAELVQLAHAQLPGVPITASDVKFQLVSYQWLEEFVEWTWTFDREIGLDYVPESFDCDDYAMMFSLFSSRVASLAGVKASPLVGRIVVRHDIAFGGVKATPGKNHALICVATDRGIYIVEPQTNSPFRLVPLTKYKNRIWKLTLGG
jgi:hypothetical protein